MNVLRSILVATVLAHAWLVADLARAADDDSSPMITEGYYRVRWGHFDEFMELFKKNHFPILRELEKQGLIESMTASFPVHHASEDSRWDFRMTIVIPDTQGFAEATERISKKLYPDQEALAKAERHRFSLLDAHTDLVIREADLSSW